MISFNIPLLIVVGFLLLTLVVGLYFSRKTTTLREYAVGNKQFATATLVATVLATAYGGGGLLYGVKLIYSHGFYWILVVLSDSLALWIISPLALRMTPFMQNLSMAETIGNVYGSYPRVIVALSGICCFIVIVAIQINVMSTAIGMCIDIDASYYQLITILASVILIVYSTSGGIRAVTFTDVLQFITFTLIIPLLAWSMFQKTGKPVAAMIPFLQSQEKFHLSSVFHFDAKLVAMITLILSNFMGYIDPTLIQRVYMSSGPIQARSVFFYSGLFSFLIGFFIILIVLFVVIGVPELSVEEIWPYIMTHISPIFQGLISISLLAMAMSSADSRLNACAVMVSHDIVESIRGVKNAAHPLRLARGTVLVVGILAMLLAFKCSNILKLLLLIFDFSIPIITAPFLLAVFGFRGTSRTALIGMATGAVAILAWKKWVEPLEPTMGIDGAFPCMLANGLAMLTAHYLLPQPEGSGWAEPDDELKQIRQAHARKKSRRKRAVKAFFTKKKYG